MTPINYQISYDAYKEFVDAQGVTQVRIVTVINVIIVIIVIIVTVIMIIQIYCHPG